MERSNELKESLEHLKVWIDQYLHNIDPTLADSTNSWADWVIPSIHHAIDHIITDHCKDE